MKVERTTFPASEGLARAARYLLSGKPDAVHAGSVMAVWAEPYAWSSIATLST